MRTINVQQGTAAWLSARVGLVTASRLKDVMAKRKNGTAEMACRVDYRMELICERLTQKAAEHYVSPEMDHGTAQEPFARAAYEVMADVMVDEVGLVLHPTLDYSAASPDGLIGDDGAIEIKAPKTATHLAWRMADVVPEEHRDQMQWVMACCDRKYCEFISFDPRLPQGLRFFVKRLERDERRIAEMEFEVITFNAEVEAQCAALGYPDCTPKAPVIRHRSSETERIGGLDVPSDISQMLDDERVDLGMTP